MSSYSAKASLLVALKGVRDTTLTTSRLNQALVSGLAFNPQTGNPDAATITLSSSFQTAKTTSSRARDNVVDGMSIVEKAGGAVDAMSSLLEQMAELSAQAESSGISSDTRTAIGNEFEQLRLQYNTIVSNTYHNDKNLLAGQAQEVSVQAGEGSANTITFSIGAELSGSTGGSPTTSGDGTLESENQVYNTPAGSVSMLANGDFDNDGFEDVAVANNSTIRIMLGNGDGTFDTTNSFSTGMGSYGIQSLDLNGDSYDDIVLTGSTGVLRSYLSNGNGTFAANDTEVGLGAGTLIMSDIIGNDGNVDAISALAGGTAIGTFAGDGSGGFGAVVMGGGTTTANIAGGPNVIAAANLDAGNNKDIVVATTAGIEVMTTNGGGFFTSIGVLDNTVDFRSVTLGDINSDGNQDIVAASSTGTLYSYLGNGDGTFDAATTVATSGYKEIKLTDIDNDGNLDAVTHAGDILDVHLGNGDGTFDAATQYGSVDTNGFGTVVADFTGDGAVDVVYSDELHKINIREGGTATTGGGSTYDRQIGALSLSSTANAETASATIAIYQDFVSRESGNLDAQYSRLTSAYQVLDRQTTNNDTALSRVRDIDTATVLAQAIAANLRSDSARSAFEYATISVKQAAKIIALLGNNQD